MSQTTRRPKFFKPDKSEYPFFPGWNRTLVDAQHMLTPLVVMDEETMATMPEEAREVRGIPTHIYLDAARRTLKVYPVPDAEYDAVTETKGWQN